MVVRDNPSFKCRLWDGSLRRYDSQIEVLPVPLPPVMSMRCPLSRKDFKMYEFRKESKVETMISLHGIFSALSGKELKSANLVHSMNSLVLSIK